MYTYIHESSITDHQMRYVLKGMNENAERLERSMRETTNESIANMDLV